MIESIKSLAKTNCYPKRLEEIDKTIPYFKLIKNQLGKYDIECFEYKYHDNADRMYTWEGYLKQSILPNIDAKIDLTGFYNIQLHDSYTYLNDNKNYKDVFCFSKFKDDNNPVLIPDPYMIYNWNNILNNINDKQEWKTKKNKIIFCGTTTGNRNPIKNERINMCLWSLNNIDFCDFNITKVAQMNIYDIQNIEKIYTKPLNISEQLNYKYHLSIDGNTSRFDIWPYKTNTVNFKYKSNEVLWYYPLLIENEHYIEVDKNNIREKFNFYNNNNQLAELMIEKTKKMAIELFRPISHQIYMVNLFESIGLNR